MAPKDRKRRSDAAEGAGPIPRAHAVRFQRRFNPGAAVRTERADLQRAHDADQAFGQSWTPYGPLLKYLDLHYEEAGTPQQIVFVCPRAFLYLACTESPAFAALLSKCVGVPILGEAWPSDDVFAGGRSGRIVIYADEVRPGNIHRPETARLYLGTYWTLMEFPEWFRKSQNAWFPLCYLRAKAIEQFDAGWSQLMAALLTKLFSPAEGGENLAVDGIRVPLSKEEPKAFLYTRLTWGCFLADESGLKHITGAKGSGGVKPCLCCQNVVSSARFPTPEDTPDGLVHISEHRKDKFCAHTREGILSVADYLKRRSRDGDLQLGPGEFKELQTSIGFNYEPKGLLWSDIRFTVAIPRSIYWDGMHSVYASGGVAAREINQFLRRVKDHCRLQDLDSITRDIVTFPKTLPRLNLKLSERVVDKDDGVSLRAFASETIQVLTVLTVFCVEWLEPKALLLEEVECLKLMAQIDQMLRRGDAVARTPAIERLDELIEDHHRRFVALYPTVVTPKLHYFRHIPDLIKRWGVYLNCWAPERKHRVSKRVAAHCFRNFAPTITVRAVRQQVEALKEPTALVPFALVGSKGKSLTPKQAALLFASGAPLPPSPDMAVTGKELKTPYGPIHVGDLAVFKEAGGAVGRGFAQSFFRLEGAGEPAFYAHVSECPRAGGSRHTVPAETRDLLVDGKALLGACPYYVKGGAIHALEADALPLD